MFAKNIQGTIEAKASFEERLYPKTGCVLTLEFKSQNYEKPMTCSGIYYWNAEDGQQQI